MQSIDVHDLPEPVAKAIEAMAQTLRQAKTPEPGIAVDEWLVNARGAAMPGVTTDGILAATRGEG